MFCIRIRFEADPWMIKMIEYKTFCKIFQLKNEVTIVEKILCCSLENILILVSVVMLVFDCLKYKIEIGSLY